MHAIMQRQSAHLTVPTWLVLPCLPPLCVLLPCCSYGKPLRVAEMNTISNSGRDGVSNVFSCACARAFECMF